MKKIILIILFFSFKIYSNEVGQFLKIGPYPIQSSLGNAGVADNNSSYLNPANIKNKRQYFRFAYNNWIQSVKLNYFNYYLKLSEQVGSLSLQYYSVKADGIDKRLIDINNPLTIPESMGSTTMLNSIMGLGYTNNIYNLDLGCKINFLKFKLDNYSKSIPTFDLGLKYNFSDNLSLGFSAKNFANSINFTGNYNETIAKEYRAGIKFKFYDFKLLTDLVKYSDKNLFINQGLEYGYLNTLFFRLGYNGNNETNMSLTYGIGIETENLGLDISFHDLDNLGTAWQLGFSYFLKPKLKKDEFYYWMRHVYQNDSNAKNEADTYLKNIYYDTPTQKTVFKNVIKSDTTVYHKIDWTDERKSIEKKWYDFKNSNKFETVIYDKSKENRLVFDFKYGILKIQKIVKNEKQPLFKSGTEWRKLLFLEFKKLFKKCNNKDLIKKLLPEKLNKNMEELSGIIPGYFNRKLKKSKKILTLTLKLKPDFNKTLENRFDKYIKKYSTKLNLSSKLVKSIIKIESNFNPNAIGIANEIGLMQITPSTAGKDVTNYLTGKNINIKKQLLNPEFNILIGSTYLKMLEYRYLKNINFTKLSRLKKLCFIITGYNAGIYYVKKFVKKNNIYKMNNIEFIDKFLNTIPVTTKKYIIKVKNYLKLY